MPKELEVGTDVEGKGLYQAASNSDIKTAKKLLEFYTGKDFLEYENNSKETPLLKACGVPREGPSEQIVELLIKAGADIHHKSKQGLTPLMTAAKKGFPKVVDLLMKNGADMDEKDPKGRTAMDLTLNADVKEVFNLIIKKKELAKKMAGIRVQGKILWDYIKKEKWKEIAEMANVKGKEIFKETFDWFEERPNPQVVKEDEEEKKPQTALEKALAPTNKKDAMRAAIAAKKAKAAKENLNSKPPPMKSSLRLAVSVHQPPLFYAIESRIPLLVEALLRGGADANVRRPSDQRTPLHLACTLPRLHAWPETRKSVEREQNRAKMVQDLIDNDCDLDARDKYGRSPIMEAAYHGFGDLIGMLAMEVETQMDGQDLNRDTAMILAARRGNTEGIAGLIEGGASVSQRGCDAMTPLMWSSYWGRIEHINMLLEGGAISTVNDRSAFGQTALYWAIENNQPAAVLRLLEVPGIDPNIGLRSGTPPLVTLCRQNFPPEVASKMLDAGANPNGRSFEGIRALHWTVLNVNEELCRVMLYAGANPLLENTNGLDAIEMAVTVKMRMMLAEAANMYRDGKKNITGIKVPSRIKQDDDED